MKLPLVFLIVLCILSCSDRKDDNDGSTISRFQELSFSETGIDFANQIKESPSRNIGTYDYFYNGGGVAIGDLNNDGLPDIFLTGNDVSNALYINEGNLRFRNNTTGAKLDNNRWSTGAVIVDINSDGWNDLYVCQSGPDWQSRATSNHLYINNKDGTFSDMAVEYRVQGNDLSTHAVFFDIDGDNDLDLFVLNHGVRNFGNSIQDWMRAMSKIDRNTYDRFCNKLYRNNGDGTFSDISFEAGVLKLGFGLGTTAADFNQDGFIDIYVANDYFIPDFLYLNDGKGNFTESIANHFNHVSYYSMGCDAADVNNDGSLDMVVLDMTPEDHYRNKVMMSSMSVEDFKFLDESMGYLPQFMFNSLQINNGAGIFSDIAHLSGIAKTDWSWAPLIADFDNDGKKDLFITNGIYRDIKNNDWRNDLLKMMNENELDSISYFKHLESTEATPLSNEIFRNLNGYEFTRKNKDWGIDHKGFSNGAAYGDLDNDGDLDLVINNLGELASVYKNQNEKFSNSNFIQFQIEGDYQSTCSQMDIWTKEGLQSNFIQVSRGYQSSVDPLVHFGVGDQNQVDSLLIHWTSGEKSLIKNLEVNRRHLIPASASKNKGAAKIQNVPLFVNITGPAIQPPAFHEENVFDDFEKEILLPHKMSRLGPALAVGDINGDQLEDFYIGGGCGDPGKIYIQNSNGFFQRNRVFDDAISRNNEELGAEFIDINGDGNLDLYIANGAEGASMQDELYVNDGKGSFEKSHLLPAIGISSKTIAPCDWDADGDLDLFIGCRNIPGNYPFSEESLFLLNEGENGFKIVFDEFDTNYGMVTDANWVDLNNDGLKELLIVGEWIHPVLLEVNDKIEDITPTEWTKMKGWWSCVEMNDMDGDGDQDLALGNLGLNNKFHPSESNPLYLFADDFDGNGINDIVLAKDWNDKLVPIRGRECTSQQMPFITQKFRTYREFANASIENILGKPHMETQLTLTATKFNSLIFENLGDMKFKQHDLPVEAQVAPIFGFVIEDFDKDGIKDIIIAGNNSHTEVETTPYDAGLGIYLKGNGNWIFQPLPFRESGIFIPGDVRDLLPIKISSDQISALIAGKNNSRTSILMKAK